MLGVDRRQGPGQLPKKLLQDPDPDCCAVPGDLADPHSRVAGATPEKFCSRVVAAEASGRISQEPLDLRLPLSTPSAPERAELARAVRGLLAYPSCGAVAVSGRRRQSCPGPSVPHRCGQDCRGREGPVGASLQMFVPRDRVGLLIGFGGRSVRMLRQFCGCDLDINTNVASQRAAVTITQKGVDSHAARSARALCARLVHKVVTSGCSVGSAIGVAMASPSSTVAKMGLAPTKVNDGSVDKGQSAASRLGTASASARFANQNMRAIAMGDARLPAHSAYRPGRDRKSDRWAHWMDIIEAWQSEAEKPVAKVVAGPVSCARISNPEGRSTMSRWADLLIEDDGIDWDGIPGAAGSTWRLYDAGPSGSALQRASMRSTICPFAITITGGEVAVIRCGWHTTIKAFKNLVARTTKQPEHLQIVLLEGKVLDDGLTLGHYVVKQVGVSPTINIVMLHPVPKPRRKLETKPGFHKRPWCERRAPPTLPGNAGNPPKRRTSQGQQRHPAAATTRVFANDKPSRVSSPRDVDWELYCLEHGLAGGNLQCESLQSFLRTCLCDGRREGPSWSELDWLAQASAVHGANDFLNRLGRPISENYGASAGRRREFFTECGAGFDDHSAVASDDVDDVGSDSGFGSSSEVVHHTAPPEPVYEESPPLKSAILAAEEAVAQGHDYNEALFRQVYQNAAARARSWRSRYEREHDEVAGGVLSFLEAADQHDRAEQINATLATRTTRGFLPGGVGSDVGAVAADVVEASGSRASAGGAVALGTLDDARAAGRPFGFPLITEGALIAALQANLQVHCGSLSAVAIDECAVCLAWFLRGEYVWVRAASAESALQPGSLFGALCKMRLRRKPSEALSEQQVADAKAFQEALQNAVLPRLQWVLGAADATLQSVVFRGTAFASVEDLSAYAGALERTTGRRLESYTTNAHVALRFAQPGAPAANIYLLQLHNLGYDNFVNTSAGLLTVYDNFEAIDLQGWAGCPAHESEVWISADEAHVHGYIMDADEAEAVLASPLPSGRTLDVEAAAAIVGAMRANAGALHICIVSALAPLTPASPHEGAAGVLECNLWRLTIRNHLTITRRFLQIK